jgi:flagellar motor protein MotB
MSVKLKNEAAMAAAQDAIQQSEIRADQAFLGDNIYLNEAKNFLVKAKEQYQGQLFSDSMANANEVLNYSTLSDNFILAENARIEQETADRVASEKVLAEPAMADARARIAWANDNSLKSDYPSQYRQASISMAAAELTYKNQRYRASQTLAENVASILADDFQTKVLSDRKAAEAAKAKPSELALAKTTIISPTDAAQADATRRMAWANENNISSDYPDEYRTASEAMSDSFTAYGTEDYLGATEKAKLVSSTLSDEFQARVLADRKAAQDAAAKLAADKAAADAVLADARARMKWADDNKIAADYADVYRNAKTSMSGAELSSLSQRYTSSKNLAEDVLSILSDSFQAKVLASRKAAQDAAAKALADKMAAQEAAAKLAADKAAADAALADARARMKWADDNKISPDYPGEYKTASTALSDFSAAYGGGDFAKAAAKAKIVAQTLSDEFQAKVLADRKASLLASMPPSVSIDVKPERFSPDEDGEDDMLTFAIDTDAASNIVDWKLEVFETAVVESSKTNAQAQERLFMSWNGKGKPPAKIDWNGLSTRKELVESATDYPFRFVATNTFGKSTTISGNISVDVLVIKDGGNLKLKVPSIVFRANYADFAGLSPDILANNEKVLVRIAQILNKYPNYKIKIQGHANSASKIDGQSQAKIQAEETNELIPLSTGRAKLVMAMLIKNGVDAKRLSVEGLGSSKPVVSFLDATNRWKNRRVEFMLIKSK